MLEKIIKRNIRNTSQRILGGGNVIKGAMASLINGLRNIPKKALRNWKNRVEDIKNKKLFDNARTSKLLNALVKIPRRTLKETHERIKGLLFASPVIKKSLQRLEQLLKRKPKQAFDKWRVYANAVKNNLILNSWKSQKLNNYLSKIPRRTMRDAVQRIVGEGSKVKGAIKQIYNTLQRKPKFAFDRWKVYIVAINKKQLFDGLRSQKLKSTLNDIIKRTMKHSSQRILGGGNIIKGALQNVINGLRNIPKKALRNWRNYVEDIKNKKLFDGARSAKLKVCLVNLPRRTLKESYERVKGIIFAGLFAKKSLQRLENLFKKKPKQGLDKWMAYAKAIDRNQLLTNLKSQKLNEKLNKVTRRTLRDAVQRIVGEGSKVKGAIKQIYNTLLRKPKTAYDRWKAYIIAINKKQLYDGARSLKLKNALENISRRTVKNTSQRILGGGNVIKGALQNIVNGLRNIPKKALRSWKKYVEAVKNKKLFDGARSAKLQNYLRNIPRRMLRESYERVKGVMFASPIVKKCIQRLDQLLKRKPKQAFEKWRNFTNAVKNNLILNNLKSQKLSIYLNKVPRRVLRDAVQRIIGDGSKVKGAIKQIYNTLLRKPKTAYDKWKAYIVAINKKQLFDGLRSQKLKIALSSIIKRTMKGTSQRILGGGNIVKGALINVINGLQNIPKKALRKWKNYIEAVKNKTLFDGARSAKLQNCLVNIPRRALRESYERVKGIIFVSPTVKKCLQRLNQILKRKPKQAFEKWRNFANAVKNNLILNNLKSQKLSICLNKVPRRVLRDAVQRIIGDGSKVKGAIKQIYNTLLRKPKTAYDKWKAYVVAINKKQLFDGLRSQKLKISLSSIIKRTMKGTSQRILGGGNVVKGALLNVINGLKNIPKKALRKWKNYIEAVKNKTLFDGARSAKLQNCLMNIPRRALRESYERVKGIIFASPAVKKCIQRLDQLLKRKPKQAFEKWRNFANAVKNNLILNNLKSQRLSICLNKVPRRVLRDAVQRIIGDGSKVKGAIKQIYNTLLRKPKTAYDRWKNYVVAINKKQLFDGLRSQKLKVALSSIIKRTMKGTSQRILGGGNVVKGALLNVINGLKNIPKKALRKWRNYIEAVKNKKLFDGARSAKLQNCLTNIPRRILRESYERVKGIIFASPAVKKCIQRLDQLLKRKPKQAFEKWRSFANSVKNNLILNNLKSQRLSICLNKVPRRVLRDAVQRIIGDGSKVKGAIKQIYNTLLRKPKTAYDKWKAYVVAINKKQLFDGLRSQKLKVALSNIIKRTIKGTNQRILGGGNVVKGALINIINGLKNIPKKSLRKWRNYIEAVKNKKLFDGARSAKLQNCLVNIPRRTLRESYERVKGIIFASPAVKKCLQRLDQLLKKKPKQAFEKWKNFANAVKNNLILNNLKSQKLSICLNKVPRRVLRDAVQRIIGDGSKVKGAIKQIYNTLLRKPKTAYDKWKAYVVAINKKQLFDGLRSQKLKVALSNIIKRTMKGTNQRILGGGNVVKGALINIINGLKNIPKKSLRKWRNYIEAVKNKKLFDGARSAKLQNCLVNIPRRILRESYERVKGIIFASPAVKKCLQRLDQLLKKKPKQAFEKWKNFANAVKNNLILNNLKSQKLSICLNKVPRRVLRDAVQRIIGDGSKVKGAIKQIYNKLLRKPKTAYDRWKAYIAAINKKQLFDGLRSQKLKAALSNIIKRTIKGANQRILGGGNVVKGALINIINGLKNIPKKSLRKWRNYIEAVKNKKLFDGARSAKLQICLTNIPRRTLKESYERVKGIIFASPAVKKCLQRLDQLLKRKPKQAFEKWRNFANAVKNNLILNNLKSQKLSICLNKVPRRVLRDAVQRIIGDGSKVKGAIKQIYNTLLRKPKTAYDRWKAYVVAINKKQLFDGLRSQKLKVALSSIIKRTMQGTSQRILGGGNVVKGALLNIMNGLKSIPKKSLRKWKNYIEAVKNKKLFDGARSAKLQNCLTNIPRRILRESYERVKGIIFASPKVKNCIKRLDQLLKRKPKQAFEKWKNFANAVKNNLILNNLKSQKLSICLNKVPRRVLRDAVQRIIGDGSKVKGAIKQIYNTLLRKPKTAYDRWKAYVVAINKKQLFDGLRSQKLKVALSSIIKRTMKGTSQRILGGGNVVKGALLNIINGLKNIPKKSLGKWKNYVEAVKNKKLFDGARSAKLQNCLTNIPRRILRESYERVKGIIFASPKVKNCIKRLDQLLKRKPKQAFEKWRNFANAVKDNLILNNLKSQKLSICLNKVPRRVLRDAVQRILGDGSKVKGAIKQIYNKLLRKPKISFDKWKSYIVAINKKQLFDGLRSQKLKIALSNLVKRTIKGTNQRILGGGNVVKGALLNVINGLKNIPKKALRKWKTYIEEVKNKKLFDGARSAKLQNCLTKLPRRTLKESYERVKGIIFASPVVKKCIQRLDQLLKHKPKQAFEKWRNFANAVKNNLILNNLKSQKLSICLSKVPRRVLRDAVQRIVGGGDKVKGAIKQIFVALQRKPKISFDKWKAYIVAINKKQLFDGLRSQKLKVALSNLVKRTIKGTSQRILGGGNVIKGALLNVINGLKSIPKNSLRKWRNYIEAVKNKKLFDGERSAKLKNCLTNIPRRVLRESYERVKGIIFASPAVKKCIQRLDQLLKRKPKQAFEKWRNFANAVKNNLILNNLKSQKLSICLNRVPRRVLRDAVQRILGDGSKVKGAIKQIYNTLLRKPKTAYDKWKAYVVAINKKQLFDGLRSQKLKVALSSIIKRTMKGTSQRILGGGNVVKGALINIMNGLKNIPKKSLRKWKNYIEAIKNKKLFDGARSAKLQNCLTNIPRRTLRESYERVKGIMFASPAVKKCIQRLDQLLKRKPKQAFEKWRNFANAVKNNLILNNLKSQKLSICLNKVPRRVLRDAVQRIIGDGSKVKGAIKQIYNKLLRKPKIAYDRWKAYIVAIHKKQLFDGLRSQKLKAALSNIIKRTMKGTSQRILGGGSVVKGALINIINGLKNIPKKSLRKWKNYVEAVKNKKLFDGARSAKLQICLTHIPRRALKESYERVRGMIFVSPTIKNCIKRLDQLLKRKPKQAFEKWRNFANAVKNNLILNNLKSQKLSICLNKVPKRVLRDAVQRIIGDGSKVKGAIKQIYNALLRKPKISFDKWNAYVVAIHKKQLFDGLRSQKLKVALSNLIKRTIKGTSYRILGSGNSAKGALINIINGLKNIPKNSLRKWKNYVESVKNKKLFDGARTAKLLNCLTKIPRRVLRGALKRILGDDTKVSGTLRRLALFMINQQRNSFLRWKSKIINSMNSNFAKGNRIKYLFQKVTSRTLRRAFIKIIGDKRAKRAVARLVRNQMNQQVSGIDTLKQRVYKLKLIRKISASYILMKKLTLKADQMKKGRFTIWRNLEWLRKRRLLRKYTLNLMFNTSVCYQSGFWRWKYTVMRHGKELHPIHAIMYKRLSNIAFNYQRRLTQFALFKIVLFFRSSAANANRKSVQLALSTLIRASHDAEAERAKSPSFDGSRGSFNSGELLPIASQLSTIPSAKKDEILAINQYGGVEVMSLHLREARKRRTIWALTSICTYSRHIGLFDDERSRLVEQINELRYDKHSLLEDNTALRMHNEALIENLEKTNIEFASLSLHLDQMRIARMVRAISKMIDLPILESLIILKHHNPRVNSSLISN